MDYLTRKSIARSTGAVGTWIGGTGYPHVRAIGVRVTRDGKIDPKEITEALNDLDLAYNFEAARPVADITAEAIDAVLSADRTPGELKQLARGFLLGIAQGAGHGVRKGPKRTLLPEYEKMMAEPPGDNVQAALDEDRCDPMMKLANSAPTNFTPPDEPKLATTHELADFAERELKKNKPKRPLAPPQGYASWLDYTVRTMDTRSLQNEHDWDSQPQWPEDVTRQDFEAAAEAELKEVRQKYETDYTTGDHITKMLSELFPHGSDRHAWLHTTNPLCSGRPPFLWRNVEPDNLFLILSVMPAGREVFRDDQSLSEWLKSWGGTSTPIEALHAKGTDAVIETLTGMAHGNSQ